MWKNKWLGKPRKNGKKRIKKKMFTVRFLKILTHHFNEALYSWEEGPDPGHKAMHSRSHG